VQGRILELQKQWRGIFSTRHHKQRPETGRSGLLSSSLPFLVDGALQKQQKTQQSS
jgi:hypothetical protein